MTCLWIVNLIACTLEPFARREGTWSLVATLQGDDEVRVTPFAAAPFSLVTLWPD